MVYLACGPVSRLPLPFGVVFFFFFQAEDGIRDLTVTGVQTCALPISGSGRGSSLYPARERTSPSPSRRWSGTACRRMHPSRGGIWTPRTPAVGSRRGAARQPAQGALRGPFPSAGPPARNRGKDALLLP